MPLLLGKSLEPGFVSRQIRRAHGNGNVAAYHSRSKCASTLASGGEVEIMQASSMTVLNRVSAGRDGRGRIVTEPRYPSTVEPHSACLFADRPVQLRQAKPTGCSQSDLLLGIEN